MRSDERWQTVPRRVQRGYAVLLNDDGYEALGLLCKVGDVLIATDSVLGIDAIYVPEENRTGYGGLLRNSVDIPYRIAKTPLRPEPVYIVEGYPAEIPYLHRRLAQENHWDTAVQFVSVNRGWNVGTQIFNSGTVMSVVQATWIGYSGLAVSFPPKLKKIRPMDMDMIAWCARRLHRGQVWSLNLPEEYCRPFTKPALCRLGAVKYHTIVSLNRNSTFTIKDRDAEFLSGDAKYCRAGWPTLVNLTDLVEGTIQRD